MGSKKLTGKEKRFCHEFTEDFNGARSARESGFSPKAAKEIAYRLLTKAHIQEYIKEITKKVEDKLDTSFEQTVSETQKIYDMCIDDKTIQTTEGGHKFYRKFDAKGATGSIELKIKLLGYFAEDKQQKPQPLNINITTTKEKTA